jgi:hypothetical protein
MRVLAVPNPQYPPDVLDSIEELTLERVAG